MTEKEILELLSSRFVKRDLPQTTLYLTSSPELCWMYKIYHDVFVPRNEYIYIYIDADKE